MAAVRGVDLVLEPGERVLIMGPSGSGKSTLLSMLGGLLTPGSGRVVLEGEDLYAKGGAARARARLERLGFIFQSFNLLSALTARENVEVPARLAGASPAAARQRALELLARLGLEGRTSHRPRDLSGGEKQRVAIARALVNGPRVLLADEPTANLDSESGRQVAELLAELAGEDGRAIVVVSHDDRLLDLATRVVFLQDGRLYDRTPESGRLHTFLFADLAGYTALTETHGDHAAADLVADFCRGVRAVLPEHEAEEIKTIGDALMLRVDDPDRAVLLGLRIVTELGRRHEFPAIRVGIHTGPAVERRGDWFGSAVNIAARVTAEAAGGEVVLTEATRSELTTPDALELRQLGPRRLKNVAEPVVLYVSRREVGGDLELDPVCRMLLERDRAARAAVHDGVEYVFCSDRCAEAFEAAPDRYSWHTG